MQHPLQPRPERRNEHSASRARRARVRLHQQWQAILRMHYSNEVTTRLAWDSLTLFRDFYDLVGMPSGYTKTGYFVIVGPEDREAMEGNVAMQRSVGVDTSLVTAEDVREIAPMVQTLTVNRSHTNRTRATPTPTLSRPATQTQHETGAPALWQVLPQQVSRSPETA